jgi:hypothetical protein
MSQINGQLQVHLTEEDYSVMGKEFSFNAGDYAVNVHKIDVSGHKGNSGLRTAAMNGEVFKNNIKTGSFEVNYDRAQQSGRLNLELNI